MLLDTPALSRADLSSLRTLVDGGALMHAPMTISYLSTDVHRLEQAARMCSARREWHGLAWRGSSIRTQYLCKLATL